MVTSVNFGGFTQVGGKFVGSGLISGLDTASLIEELVEAKRLPVVRLEDTVTNNTDKLGEFNRLKTILTSMQTSVNILRNPPGVDKENENIFKYTQAFLSSSTSVAANTYMGITTNPGAVVGSYEFENIVLAKAKAERSASFSSKTDSVTEAAGGSTAGLFSEGVLQISGGSITTQVDTPSDFELDTGDYDVTGTVTGVLDATYGVGGIQNLIAVGNDGDQGLVGTLSSALSNIAGAQVDGTTIATAGSAVVLTATINGKSYVSDNIAADTGAGTDEIAANTVITFTESTTNTSFNIRTDSAITIAVADDITTFAQNVEDALDGITIFNEREITAFDLSATTGTQLSGMEREDVQLYSDEFQVDGTHGDIESFSVTAETGPGNNDGIISVVIDGETYQNTALSGSHNTNITLTSTTTTKTLDLNIGDAGATFALSDATEASQLQQDLNTVFDVGKNITINEGDNLIEIAAAINSQTATSGLAASVLKVADGDFRLVFQATQAGLTNAYEFTDPDGVLSEVTFTTTQTANDSSIDVNGVTVTRPTNTLDDVVDDLTLKLFQDSPALTVLTADIDNNTDAVKDAIKTFLTAYNDFQIFVGEQKELDAEGQFVETAILQNDSTLTNIITNIESELNLLVSGLDSGDLASLADIGVTFNDFAGDDETPPTTNILQLDEAILDTALASKFEEVRRIFEFDFNPSSSKLAIFSRTNESSATKFVLDIDTGRASGNEVRVLAADGTTFLGNATLSGSTITAQSGTTIDGMKFVYTGDGTDVITVNASQGVGDRIYNLVSGFIEEDTGIVDAAISSLNDQNTKLNEDIDRLEENIETFREKQLLIFAALEKAVTASNSVLQLIDAQDKARENG